jgi:hypothetical protein
LKEGKVYQIEEKSRISTSDPQVTVNANWQVSSMKEAVTEPSEAMCLSHSTGKWFIFCLY